MLCLSHTTGYAVQALGLLADCAEKPCLIRDIAQKTGIPRPYLAKVINQLARRGLVAAKRGYRGGVFLKRRPEDIALLEVVEAIEGEHWLGECLLGMEACSGLSVCPTQAVWQRVCAELEEALKRTTLADVLVRRHEAARQAARLRLKPSPAGGPARPVARPARIAGAGAAACYRPAATGLDCDCGG